MAAYKRVYFHRLNLYFFTANSDKEGPVQKFIKSADMVEKFKYIFKYLSDNDKLEYQVKGKHITTFSFIKGVDNFLSSKGTIITGKLTCTRDYHSYQKRNKKTKKVSSVASKSELFEARSYFSLDLSNGTIAYLMGEKVAPYVSDFSFFIEQVTEEIKTMNKIFGEVTDLVVKNGLALLSGKRQVGSIYYSIELPKDLPIEATGIVSQNEYNMLQEQDHVTIKVGLIANRTNKSTFENSNKLTIFFNKLLKKKGIKKVSAKAKGDDEDHMREIKLVNDPFIKTVEFEYTDEDADNTFEDSIQKKLETVYKDNKTEIEKYLRQ